MLTLLALLFLPAHAFAAPVKVVAFRADSATGSTHYPIPGNGGPWIDLTGNGHDLPRAVHLAKGYLTETLRQSYEFQAASGERIHALNQGTRFA